jgi:hypothetical protein
MIVFIYEWLKNAVFSQELMAAGELQDSTQIL